MKERKRHLIELERTDYTRAKELARAEGISFPALVRRLVKAYIKRRSRNESDD